MSMLLTTLAGAAMAFSGAADGITADHTAAGVAALPALAAGQDDAEGQEERIQIYDLGPLMRVLGIGTRDEQVLWMRGVLELTYVSNFTVLGSGLFAVVGDAESLARFEGILAQLSAMPELEGRGGRAVSSDLDRGYAVRVRLLQTNSATAGRAGEPLPPASQFASTTLVAADTAATGGEPASIAATERIGYIADWAPVVSDGIAAYDPETAYANAGLEFRFEVERGFLRFEGTYSTASVEEKLVTIGDAKLPIGLRSGDDREFSGRLPVVQGREIVAATLQGFEPGTRLIVTLEIMSDD